MKKNNLAYTKIEISFLAVHMTEFISRLLKVQRLYKNSNNPINKQAKKNEKTVLKAVNTNG